MNPADILISEIKEAFKSSLPSATELISNRGMDLVEAGEFQDAFAGRDWETLSTEFLRVNCAALSYFTDRAFAYYLPAFMVASIKDWEESDIVPETVIFQLIPEIAGNSDIGRFQSLTEEQRQVVNSYWKYLADTHQWELAREVLSKAK